MSLILVRSDELRKALADIKAAEANGFMYCEAVFEPSSVRAKALHLKYSDLWERASAADPRLDWGRFQRVTQNNRWDGEKLVPIVKVRA